MGTSTSALPGRWRWVRWWGALLGARLLMGLPADRLRLFFAVVLVLLAVQMGLSALGVSLPGGGA